MPEYVKAKAGPRNSIIYTDSNGKEWIFEGGNRPWRNQNPGDLVPEGIALTEQGKVDAIIAVSPHGHPFLRGRPGHAIS